MSPSIKNMILTILLDPRRRSREETTSSDLGIVKTNNKDSTCSNLSVEQFTIEKLDGSKNGLNFISSSDSRKVGNFVINSCSTKKQNRATTLPPGISKKVKILTSPEHIPDNPVRCTLYPDESGNISGKNSIVGKKTSIMRKGRDDTCMATQPREDEPLLNGAPTALITTQV